MICCKEVFKKEFALVKLRAKAALHPRIDLWLDAFLSFFSFSFILTLCLDLSL
jgi:hypothetical protein